MPLNTNIALGFQAPQIESPVNAMLRMSQLEAANQESQLNALRARGIETTMREDENFRNALKGGGDYSDPEVQRNLLAANPARAIDLFKNLAERNKSAAEAKRIRAETADRVLGTYRAMLPGVQTPEEMAEWYRHQRGRKELEDTPVFAHSLEQKIAGIPTDPAKFAEFKAQVEMGMDKWFDRNRGIATTPGGAVQSAFKYGVQTPPITEPRPQGPQTGVTEGAPGTPKQAYRITSAPDGRLQVETAPLPGTEKPTLAETLDVREIAARDKAYIPAKTAVSAYEAKAAQYVKDLRELATHKGLAAIAGPLDARTPTFFPESVRAETLYKKILGTDILSTIENAKSASPTGSSPLGQVTNSDRDLYRDTTGLSQALDPAALKAELLNKATAIEAHAKRIRGAFDQTYEYKTSPAADPKATPTTPDTTPAKDPYANLPRVTNNDDYRKLPSGTEFIGPDNTRRRKP
jgi:hypothetical protein